jgi:RNA-splicing ligase RtcB
MQLLRSSGLALTGLDIGMRESWTEWLRRTPKMRSRVAEVYDGATATRLGLYSGNVAVQIHCGSRGLGHQICEDYVSRFQKTARDYGIELPDRELVCAPFDSTEGQEYFRAMACAANFAFANRQLLAHMILPRCDRPF